MLLQENGGTLLHVKTQADYSCLTGSYPVVYNFDPYSAGPLPWTVESEIPAPCPSGDRSLRLPDNATNWVLREANGTAWFVDGQSRLRWIPDGGCFISLTKNHLVIDHADWVSQSSSSRLLSTQGTPAESCAPGPSCSRRHCTRDLRANSQEREATTSVGSWI